MGKECRLMKVKKIAAVYSIIVGVSMIGMWTLMFHQQESREFLSRRSR